MGAAKSTSCSVKLVMSAGTGKFGISIKGEEVFVEEWSDAKTTLDLLIFVVDCTLTACITSVCDVELAAELDNTDLSFLGTTSGLDTALLFDGGLLLVVPDSLLWHA